MGTAVGGMRVEGQREAESSRPLADAATPPLRSADAAMGSGDPVLVLRSHVLRAVVALVPADAAVFIALSRRRAIEEAVALVDPERRLDVGGLWPSYAAEVFPTDPFAPAALDPASATVLALAQVEARAPAYADHLHAAGVRDRLVLYLRSSGMVVAMVSLLRAAPRPRFTASDASGLRRIHSLVERVYVAAVERSSAAGESLDALRERGLTAREAEVAELVGRGASNADIARALHLSELTIKTHLTRVYTKLGVRTRTQLAILVGGATARA